jgi:hypothetical protein
MRKLAQAIATDIAAFIIPNGEYRAHTIASAYEIDRKMITGRDASLQ